MRRDKRGLVQWGAMVGLIGLLALGGCSKKNVMATTSGGELSQAGAGAKAEGGQSALARKDEGTGPGGTQGGGGADSSGGGLGSGGGPLQGFSRVPAEERAGSSTMVAKADQTEIDARRAREAAKRQLADIYFAYDKWALSNEGKKNLAESAEFLKQNPATKLLIEGHCDERGSREYNLVLGEKRAKEARRYLMDLGLKNPVSINSFGKERPVCAEHDESCYWKNRRAHLAVEAGP